MKKEIALLSIILALSAATHAQHKYVSIVIDSANIGGIRFPAVAHFECMIWNARTSTVTLQWRAEARGYDGSIIKSVPLEMLADTTTYVLQDGSIIGELPAALKLYCAQDSNGNYQRTTGGKYAWNRLVFNEYEFYQSIAEYGANGATINQLLKAAGMRRKSDLLKKLESK